MRDPGMRARGRDETARRPLRPALMARLYGPTNQRLMALTLAVKTAQRPVSCLSKK